MEGGVEKVITDVLLEQELNAAQAKVQTQRMRHLVAALRSGQFPQTSRVLRQVKEQGEHGIGMCCLGVACEVAIADGLLLERRIDGWAVSYKNFGGGHTNTVLPLQVQQWYGVADDNPYLKVPDETAAEVDSEEFQVIYQGHDGGVFMHSAAELNDEFRLNFAQIADCFEYTFLPDDWEVTRASR